MEIWNQGFSSVSSGIIHRSPLITKTSAQSSFEHSLPPPPPSPLFDLDIIDNHTGNGAIASSRWPEYRHPQVYLEYVASFKSLPPPLFVSLPPKDHAPFFSFAKWIREHWLDETPEDRGFEERFLPLKRGGWKMEARYYSSAKRGGIFTDASCAMSRGGYLRVLYPLSPFLSLPLSHRISGRNARIVLCWEVYTIHILFRGDIVHRCHVLSNVADYKRRRWNKNGGTSDRFSFSE